MKRRRHTPDQVIRKLAEGEKLLGQGQKLDEVVRHLEITGYFSAQYSRIARRRGPNKATVAVAHSILDVAWHLLTNGVLYDDSGARFFELRHDPNVEAKRRQRRIEALGFEVTLTAAAA